jgi:hypothetical protein
MKKLVYLLTAVVIFSHAISQELDNRLVINKRFVEVQNIETPQNVKSFFQTHENSNSVTVYDTSKWRRLVDEAWGQGLDTDAKLRIFDHYWDTISTSYASFPNLVPINWDSTAKAYRDEIASGVSKGRFLSIMNQLILKLNDGHTIFRDFEIYYSDLYKGLPLVNPEGHCNFAACLTILPDSTALVYNSVPNNVFELVPGDVILGYNSRSLAYLTNEVIEKQLPVQHSIGSTYEATWHNMMIHVAASWNLYDTLDILKKDGRIMHFPTSLMIGKHYVSDCYEIIPPQGIRLPRYQQLIERGNQFAYGLIPGTNIGYVAMLDCLENSGDSLLNIFKYLCEYKKADGIIFDIRTNYGGTIQSFAKAFSYLYNDDLINWLACAQRVNSTNRYLLSEDEWTWGYNVYENDNYSFKKPIALLTGPNAISAGDILPVYFRNHPSLKIFGKPTAAAFGSITMVDIQQPQHYFASMQSGNFFLVSEPGKYLSHSTLKVDYPVWLSPEGAANKKDDVIEAALKWIQSATDIVESDNPTTLEVYPNPAIDFININVDKPGNATIYNSTGYKLYSVVLNNTNNRINVSDLSTGLYFIEYQNGQQTIKARFIKY